MSRTTVVLCVLAVALSATAQPAASPGAGTPSPSPNATGAKLTGFEGPWQCTADPAGATGVCRVERVQGVMVLRRPKGEPSVGMMLGPKLVRAQDWGPIKGTLSADEQTLTWTNGAVWKRPAAGPATPTPSVPPKPSVPPPTTPPATKPPAGTTPPQTLPVPAWGIVIRMGPDGAVVVSVAPDGLGHEADLAPGTLIITIGTRQTKDMSLAEVVAAMGREPMPPIAFVEPTEPVEVKR